MFSALEADKKKELAELVRSSHATNYHGQVVRIAIIGCGAVAALHHVPGIALDARLELVCLCEPNEALRTRRAAEWEPLAPADGGFVLTDSYEEACALPSVDAVVICTPNKQHKPITLAALAHKKHVLCEKPLALNALDAAEMEAMARNAGVRHMTALTYRFHPGLRYLKHLVHTGALGEIRHFRSQRFLDWPETSWGWRQYRETAGAGDLYDMTIHRIDFAVDILGPIQSVAGAVARFAPRTTTPSGGACEPSEVDDWSALIGRFESGAVGVWEGSTLMKGRHNGGLGHEWAEVNGALASAVYQISEPTSILLGKHGESLERCDVPPAFLKLASSPRDVSLGDPAMTYRYDIVCEFASAILAGRDCEPSFAHGAAAQAVADAVLQSSSGGGWIELPKAKL